jgi:hypothetical protein
MSAPVPARSAMKVIHHWHVVSGMPLTTVEHDHECHPDVPHFHSAGYAGSPPLGPSLWSEPRPRMEQPGDSRLRLWRPRH